MAYKNVGKPTFLFFIFRCIVTLPSGGVTRMNTNLKGELTLMDSLGIKPNYAALGRKYEMDWRTVKKYHVVGDQLGRKGFARVFGINHIKPALQSYNVALLFEQSHLLVWRLEFWIQRLDY